VNHLNLEKADIMGYSLGGEVAVLVFRDADAVRTAHAVEFFELLVGRQEGRRVGGLGYLQRPPALQFFRA
jgi:pimeloyl-ACP methyl ester carboxylesterase